MDIWNVLERLKEILIGNSEDIIKKTEVHDWLFEKSVLVACYEKEANSRFLWDNLIEKDGNSVLSLSEIYKRLYLITQIYKLTGKDVKAIAQALDWLADNFYNTQSDIIGNWYEWEIRIPMLFTQTAVMLGDEIKDKTLEKYDKMIHFLSPTPAFHALNTVISTGANLAWKSLIEANLGLLMQNISYVQLAKECIERVFDYASEKSEGDGFYPDGSFIQHKCFPYAGSYGVGLLYTVCCYAYIFHGTEYAFSHAQLERIKEWIQNAFEPYMFKGAMLESVKGRWRTRMQYVPEADYLAALAAFSCITCDYDIYKIIKNHLEANNDLLLVNQPSLWFINIMMDVISNKIKSENNFQKPKFYLHYNQDQAIMKTPEWSYNVVMHSERICNYESLILLRDNLKGWYQSDGMTYFYVTPNDYRNCWVTIDPHRLGGITVDRDLSRTKASSRKTPMPSNWVGGVNFKGICGAMGMEFKQHDWSNMDLYAKKSYFLYDVFILVISHILPIVHFVKREVFAEETTEVSKSKITTAKQLELYGIKIENLPNEFYEREGLENMPRIDYAQMPVVNVRDIGASGTMDEYANGAFSEAVSLLREIGGGIIYVPKGVYRFKAPVPPDRNFWLIGDGEYFSNIHFIGEGEDSKILFEYPKVPYTQPAYGWHFSKGENVSVRNMSFQNFPFYDSRSWITAGYAVSATSNMQIINCIFDNVRMGVVSWANNHNVYVVDCQIRNTTSDGFKTENSSGVVAAYNWVENAGDDSVGVYNPKGEGNLNTSYDNIFIGNTILRNRWGRGIISGGTRTLVKNNWIESTTTGILVFDDGKAAHPIVENVIDNNTIIRASLSELPENVIPGYRERAGIKVFGEGSNLKITNNKILNGCYDGILLGERQPFKITDVEISNNIIELNDRYGFSVQGSASEIDGLNISGNIILDNGRASVYVENISKMEGVITQNNKVSDPPQGITGGFTVSDEKSVYTDIYKQRLREEKIIGFIKPEVLPLGNLPVVNVRDFGAQGNGENNDLPAFYAALDSLEDGGIIRIPEGKYLLEPIEGRTQYPLTAIEHVFGITDRNNIHILGDGENSELIFNDVDKEGIRFVNVINGSIKNISVRQKTKAATRHNRSLIDISGSRNVIVQGVSSYDSAGQGLQVDSSILIGFYNNKIERAYGAGIRIYASRQVFVEDNTILDCYDHGISINYNGTLQRLSEYIKLKGNHIKKTYAGHGIAVATGSYINVEDNIIEDTYLPGLSIYQPNRHYPVRNVDALCNTIKNCNIGPLSYFKGAISVGYCSNKHRGMLYESIYLEQLNQHAAFI